MVQCINYDLSESGHKLCIIDTKGSHADLTPEYAAIPPEMKSIAEHFGKTVLREITKDDVMENIVTLREKCGDRAVLRALHFFDENERVAKQEAALERGRFSEFLKLVNESGDSSLAYLQNIFSAVNVREQGLTIALYLGKKILGFVTNADLVRSFVDRYGIKSRIIFVCITVFQIILAFFPACNKRF